MSEARLTARSLSIRLGGRPVLRSVAFDAQPGEIIAVLGRNGAGKSTLVRALLGLVHFEGSITVEGDDLRSLSPLERAGRIGYVPQRTALDVDLDARRVIAMGRYAVDEHGGDGTPTRRVVDGIVDRLGLAAIADRRFSVLSGGERARVLVARALATGASTLILDEPDASLDIHQALALHDLIRRLADAGRTMIYVLHRLDDARRFADRALLLEGGVAVAFGPPALVLAPDRIREVFQVEPIARGATGYALPSEAAE